MKKNYNLYYRIIIYIITNWFSKNTTSGRTLYFLSNHPIALKINIVYNLIDRAILLSDKKFHKSNKIIVKKLLSPNNYSTSFIQKYIINKRIFKITHNNIPTTKNNFNYKSIFSLPFLNNNIFSKFKHILIPFKILVIPKIIHSLNYVIRLGKDVTSQFDNINVMYRIRCKQCPAEYTGQTKRQLKFRID